MQPLVSVIVPTYNSARTLAACLASICVQTYPRIELIVVDNSSTDHTKTLAAGYTKLVFNQGSERSAQRNYGAAKAAGQYLAMIDSDMELSPQVVADCVQAMMAKPAPVACIIPEQSFGEGFWAQCKQLERSFYIGSDAIEGARFFRRDTYLALRGYDETLVSGEDWELTSRLRALGAMARVSPLIRHNEGRLSLGRTLQKKYYYARHARAYLAKAGTGSKLMAAAGPLARYRLFLSRPVKLFRQPIIGVAMLAMKTSEFAAGGLGYIWPGRVAK